MRREIRTVVVDQVAVRKDHTPGAGECHAAFRCLSPELEALELGDIAVQVACEQALGLQPWQEELAEARLATARVRDEAGHCSWCLLGLFDSCAYTACHVLKLCATRSLSRCSSCTEHSDPDKCSQRVNNASTQRPRVQLICKRTDESHDILEELVRDLITQLLASGQHLDIKPLGSILAFVSRAGWITACTAVLACDSQRPVHNPGTCRATTHGRNQTPAP